MPWAVIPLAILEGGNTVVFVKKSGMRELYLGISSPERPSKPASPDFAIYFIE